MITVLDQGRNLYNSSYICFIHLRFTTLAALIEHDNVHHNVKTSLKELTFTSFHSFLEWKKQMEVETSSQYVQRCSKQKSNVSTRYYYYCNRSGTYVSKGTGKRANKSQGTNKIGSTCPAHIKAFKSNECDVIRVEYYDGHNHSTSLGHIQIPDDTRLVVAQKLNDGVTVPRILDFIREDVDKQSPHYTRQHIITKQDVYNIKRQFNIEGIQRHKDDQTSLCAWVSELTQSSDYNPILLFKPQGQEDSNQTLAKEDFVLGIQTRFQLDTMKLFAGKIVCLDSTHGTNHYDFKLVTVLVLDDFGEGIPVAWLISNKEDTITLTTFLQALLGRTGPIESKFFMSDDAQQYYTAWNTVYGGNSSKLLCTWHVDKAWRAKIRELISDDGKKADVYFNVRTLLQELSTSQFRRLMQTFLTQLLSDESLKEFGEYFQTNYAKRCEQWAYCYRIGTPINTNMTIESFHRLLKVVYLDSKHNRRIDQLLSVLLKIARDKEFERLIKHEKGKLSYRTSEMNKRHSAAANLKTLEHTIEGKWKVPSQSLESKTEYTVERILEQCDCKIKCRECQVCTHLYHCSCVDYAVHNTACKHIHAVHMKHDQPQLTNHHQTSVGASNTTVATTPNIATENEVFFQHSTPRHELPRLRNEFQVLLDEAKAIVQETDDTELLKCGLAHMRSCVSVMRSISTPNST